MPEFRAFLRVQRLDEAPLKILPAGLADPVLEIVGQCALVLIRMIHPRHVKLELIPQLTLCDPVLGQAFEEMSGAEPGQGCETIRLQFLQFFTRGLVCRPVFAKHAPSEVAQCLQKSIFNQRCYFIPRRTLRWNAQGTLPEMRFRHTPEQTPLLPAFHNVSCLIQSSVTSFFTSGH